MIIQCGTESGIVLPLPLQKRLKSFMEPPLWGNPIFHQFYSLDFVSANRIHLPPRSLVRIMDAILFPELLVYEVGDLQGSGSGMDFFHNFTTLLISKNAISRTKR